MNRTFLLIAVLALGTPSAHAWENHAFGTWAAIEKFPSISQIPVVTETLESFLAAEKKGLAKLLAEEENWARVHVPSYPARPDVLAFNDKEEDPVKLRTSFLKAIRVNPTMKLPLFLQQIPGYSPAHFPGRMVEKNTTPIALEDFTLLPQSIPDPKLKRFVQIREGEKIDAVSVVLTASDEPDYGLDINLWSNNPGGFGKEFQFGDQPFGNPVLDFASQAPFHMGFFHENFLAYKIASYLKRTYPEYRIHLFLSLARYALQKGHPYWSFRFAGWGAHYVQDLTQPYHSTVTPGTSFSKTFFLGLLDLIGVKGPVKNMIQLLTNEHLALESYQFQAMTRALNQSQDEHPLFQALRSSRRGDLSYGRFDDDYPRNVISLESFDQAKATHLILHESLPARIVADPQYLFGITEPEIDLLTLVEKSAKSPEVQAQLGELLQHFGAHTRNYIRAVLVK